jgi:hypothetical protein
MSDFGDTTGMQNPIFKIMGSQATGQQQGMGPNPMNLNPNSMAPGMGGMNPMQGQGQMQGQMPGMMGQQQGMGNNPMGGMSQMQGQMPGMDMSQQQGMGNNPMGNNPMGNNPMGNNPMGGMLQMQGQMQGMNNMFQTGNNPMGQQQQMNPFQNPGNTDMMGNNGMMNNGMMNNGMMGNNNEQMMQQQMQMMQQQMMQQMQQQMQQNMMQQQMMQQQMMQQKMNSILNNNQGGNNPQTQSPSPPTMPTSQPQPQAGQGFSIIFRASGATGQAGAPIMVQCMPNDKVSDVIEKYRNKANDRDDTKKFIFNAKNLNTNLSVAEAGITNNANIFVVATKGIKGAF